MKISSTKAGGARNRVKVEHEGEVRSVGFHFQEKGLQLSLYSGDRSVKVHIPVPEMEKIIKDYLKFKADYPDHFKD